MGWVTVLFMGTLVAALLAFVVERVEIMLARLRLEQEIFRSAACSSPSGEVFRLREAIRSADLPAIHDLATWRALAYAAGETLRPFGLAVLHRNRDDISIVRKAYHRHRQAYRFEHQSNPT